MKLLPKWTKIKLKMEIPLIKELQMKLKIKKDSKKISMNKFNKS